MIDHEIVTIIDKGVECIIPPYVLLKKIAFDRVGQSNVC